MASYGRTVDPDSEAYAQIGKRCVFCRGEIRHVDVYRPNCVYTNQKGDKTCHDKCLEYIGSAYPGVPAEHFEGKLIVTRRESGVIAGV